MNSNNNNIIFEEISKRTQSFLRVAKKAAEKSTFRSRHGAILVKGGNIINTACNENTYCSFGARFREKQDGCATQHAEIRCILGIGRKMTAGATLYVVRINDNGDFRLSKPCSMCISCLKFVGIHRVVYTTNNNGIEIISL